MCERNQAVFKSCFQVLKQSYQKKTPCKISQKFVVSFVVSTLITQNFKETLPKVVVAVFLLHKSCILTEGIDPCNTITADILGTAS